MRIRKKYQVIPTNAKLENGDSTSNKNGYTANYINNHSVVVSPTEPITDRKKVWLQKGNGIDDKTFILNENNIYEEFVQYDELFTTNGATDGKYLNSNGGEVDDSSWHITKFIKVKANKRYVICVDSSVNLGNNASICFCNSSKTFIKGGAFSNYTYRIILTPQNTEYVKISYSNTNVNSISFKPMEIAYYEYEGYTSTYGTLRDTKCIIKGNIVTFSCRLDVTTAISNGNQLITGLPRSFVNHIGLMAYDNVGPGYYNFSFNTGNIQYNTSGSSIPIDRSLRIVFTYVLGDIFTIS